MCVPRQAGAAPAEAAYAERVRYNKAYYSLDCDDGIEYSACVHEPSPQELGRTHRAFLSPVETLASVLIAALAFAFLSTAALTLCESNGYRCYTEVRS